MGSAKHGARQLERLLRSGALDRRTGTAREYLRIQDVIAKARGGWGACTPEERLLIERVGALVMICRTVEQHVLTTGILPGGELAPVLARGYATYVENLRRALLALNLRPDVVERLPDIGKLLREQPEEPEDT